MNNSWKEKNLLHEMNESEDKMSFDEVAEYVEAGCPLVARDYSTNIVGIVFKTTHNLDDLKNYDNFGMCFDSEQEELYREFNDFIAVKVPFSFFGYVGMKKAADTIYAYDDSGAYVLKSDNEAMMSLYDEKLFHKNRPY